MPKDDELAEAEEEEDYDEQDNFEID